MYTKMTNYRHFKSVHKISRFSGPKSEGLLRHRVFVGLAGPGWGRFVNLGFLFLYFRGYKQLYTFNHAMC